MPKNEFILSYNTGTETVEIGVFPDAFSLYAYLGNIPHQISHSMTLNQPWAEKPERASKFKIGQEFWLSDSFLGTRKGRTAKKNRTVLDCIRPERGRQYAIFRGITQRGNPSNSDRQITYMPLAWLGTGLDSDSIYHMGQEQENYQPQSKTTGLHFYYDENRKEVEMEAYND